MKEKLFYVQDKVQTKEGIEVKFFDCKIILPKGSTGNIVAFFGPLHQVAVKMDINENDEIVSLYLEEVKHYKAKVGDRVKIVIRHSPVQPPWEGIIYKTSETGTIKKICKGVGNLPDMYTLTMNHDNLELPAYEENFIVI